VFTFCLLVQTLKISRTAINRLWKFILCILPADSNVPKTYNQLLKILEPTTIKAKKICVVCSILLNKNESCQNRNCQNVKKQAKYTNAIDPTLFEFDYLTKLKSIVEKNWTRV
jgi:hypothetical protein